jgi:hypothetical protein
MGMHGLLKASHGIAKRYAIRDWQVAARYAVKVNQAVLAARHEPDFETYGVKKIDECTKALIEELGVTGKQIGLVGVE